MPFRAGDGACMTCGAGVRSVSPTRSISREGITGVSGSGERRESQSRGARLDLAPARRGELVQLGEVFELDEDSGGSAERPTVLTGFLLGGVVAELDARPRPDCCSSAWPRSGVADLRARAPEPRSASADRAAPAHRAAGWVHECRVRSTEDHGRRAASSNCAHRQVASPNASPAPAAECAAARSSTCWMWTSTCRSTEEETG